MAIFAHHLQHLLTSAAIQTNIVILGRHCTQVKFRVHQDVTLCLGNPRSLEAGWEEVENRNISAQFLLTLDTSLGFCPRRDTRPKRPLVWSSRAILTHLWVFLSPVWWPEGWTYMAFGERRGNEEADFFHTWTVNLSWLSQRQAHVFELYVGSEWLENPKLFPSEKGSVVILNKIFPSQWWNPEC